MMNRTAKTVAMLSLSACVLVGSAVCSFAAEPTATATVTGRTTSSCCDGGAKNKILARFQNEDGTVSNYSICSEGGEVNGVAALEEVDYAFSNFSGTTVYEGILDNGEKVMTVTCSSQYVANIDINKEAVEGYDLYVVNNDGTETKLEVGIGARRASFKVDMSQGAVLIHMVAQN